ncbi:MAG: response regulator, partial [Candidatus Competibacteraceae bacterium]|nr:response regulator [Candidatus Competibacteraceae bacterium]
ADSLHVLLVEDNEDARKATARLLQLAGFQVSAADNGASALQLTGVKRPPDVALVDINLPDMDGYALVQQLKMLPGTEHMRFIALSGQA